MAIRLKNLEAGARARSESVALGVIPVGVTNIPIFVAPVDCKVDQVDLYANNAFSAGSGGVDSLHLHIYPHGASACYAQVFNANTSAATNTFTALQRIRLTPSANNSLTAGKIFMLQVSAVCQAVMSGTFCRVTYTPFSKKKSTF